MVPQLEELVDCRGEDGPLLFPRLWNEIDALRDMKDRKRSRLRGGCEVLYGLMAL